MSNAKKLRRIVSTVSAFEGDCEPAIRFVAYFKGPAISYTQGLEYVGDIEMPLDGFEEGIWIGEVQTWIKEQFRAGAESVSVVVTEGEAVALRAFMEYE